MELVYSKKLIEILTTGKDSIKYTLNFLNRKYFLTPPKSCEYYKGSNSYLKYRRFRNKVKRIF